MNLQESKHLVDGRSQSEIVEQDVGWVFSLGLQNLAHHVKELVLHVLVKIPGAAEQDRMVLLADGHTCAPETAIGGNIPAFEHMEHLVV